jgi:hypothetical protein
MSSLSFSARPSPARTQAWTLGLAGTGSFMVVLDLFYLRVTAAKARGPAGAQAAVRAGA